MLPLLWVSRSEISGAGNSRNRACTFVNYLSAVLVDGEIYNFSIGSCCVGLNAGTWISLLLEIGTPWQHWNLVLLYRSSLSESLRDTFVHYLWLLQIWHLIGHRLAWAPDMRRLSRGLIVFNWGGTTTVTTIDVALLMSHEVQATKVRQAICCLLTCTFRSTIISSLGCSIITWSLENWRDMFDMWTELSEIQPTLWVLYDTTQTRPSPALIWLH